MKSIRHIIFLIILTLLLTCLANYSKLFTSGELVILSMIIFTYGLIDIRLNEIKEDLKWFTYL